MDGSRLQILRFRTLRLSVDGVKEFWDFRVLTVVLYFLAVLMRSTVGTLHRLHAADIQYVRECESSHFIFC